MLIHIMIGSVLVFVVVQLCIELLNWYGIKPFPKEPIEENLPFVSVLVPARNEEQSIGVCVQSLVEQRYPDYEVIVLNDHSEDNTEDVLDALQKQFDTLRVVEGKSLPKGWYGKHWACWQLAKLARGSWILFTDADTTHDPTMLRSCVSLAQAEKLDLLTAFVYQKMQTWGELITVPFPVWSIFALLPVGITRRFRLPAFSAVNGQFMFFKKDSYISIGGHRTVRNHAVDDISLGRLIVKKGYNWAMHDATKLVSCRMYRSLTQAVEGFTRNYFALFDYRVVVSGFIWFWMIFVYGFPLLLIIQGVCSILDAPWSWLVVTTVALQLIVWALPTLRFRMPMVVVLLYPVIVLLASGIGLTSMVCTMSGKAMWKGRTLGNAPIKWF